GTQLALRDLVRQHNVYMGELNDQGTKLVAVHRFSFGVGCEDLARAWTPDSKAVFLDSNRSGHWEIYKQALNSDSDEPFVQGPDDQFDPRVSPDGASLLYIDRPRVWREPQPASLMRVPITGGVPQLVLRTSHFSEWGLRFECPRRAGMPCVLAQRQGRQIVFRAFDPAKGFRPGSKELANTGYIPDSHLDWRLAPDGRSIAWILADSTDNRIHVLRLVRSANRLISGGSERDIAVSGGPYLHSIAWSPDGKGWFIVRQLPASWTLVHADLEGSASTLLSVPSAFPPDVIPSPDGRHLAFSEESFTSNVWLLKDF
ncbi:MAG: TolB family protein, partial [Terriglobia bacterium]